MLTSQGLQDEIALQRSTLITSSINARQTRTTYRAPGPAPQCSFTLKCQVSLACMWRPYSFSGLCVSLCQHHVAHIKCNFIILHMLFINFIGHHTQVNKGLPYSSYASARYNEQDHCGIALCNVRASLSIFFAYIRDAVAMRGHVVDAGHR